ncbi:hypothetical protein E2F47_03535 [Mycobacterium eburneum]|nr:hypothetical protein [Mycobacterium eburneum]TDH57238.1 hypothetical protein E2F47_03535 [Mycobacterium eburneum]
MPGIDKPTGRVLALIVLLVLGAAALRGYLPDAGRRARHPPEHPGSAFAMAALLSVTVAILAVSLIVRLRDRRTLPRGSAELAEGTVGAGGRPSWRVVLIGLGVLLAWLLIVVLLVRWSAPHGFGPPEPAPHAPPRPPGGGGGGRGVYTYPRPRDGAVFGIGGGG